MIVNKLDAAYEQLNTAIFLFFQDLNPISVHTLAGAALQILNDHVIDKNAVYDNNLIAHYDSIYIKDERRAEYHKAIMKYRNFFKHADKDANSKINFNPKVNEFFILEAIHVYDVVCDVKAVEKPILAIFLFWFIFNNPDLIESEYMEKIMLQYRSNSMFRSMDIKSKQYCYEMVKYCLENGKESF